MQQYMFIVIDRWGKQTLVPAFGVNMASAQAQVSRNYPNCSITPASSLMPNLSFSSSPKPPSIIPTIGKKKR